MPPFPLLNQALPNNYSIPYIGYGLPLIRDDIMSALAVMFNAGL